MRKLKAKLDQEIYQEALDSKISPEISASIALGAIWDLMGHLTSLKTPIKLGNTENVDEALAMISNFFEERNISDRKDFHPMIKNWQDLIHPTK